MMPNSAADIVANLETVDPPQLPSPSKQAEASATDPVVTETSSRYKAIDISSSAADEWFPDYEAGSPWKPQEESRGLLEQGRDGAQEVELEPPAKPDITVQPEQPAQLAQLGSHIPAEPEQTAQREEAPTEAVELAQLPEIQPAQEQAVEEHDAPSGPSHASKDSFARTVSQQPDLMSDDEPEWTSPRAETDLFSRFMPPNNRTNSFPVVPKLEHQKQQHDVEPLPTNQAEDIINEIEHQSEPFEPEGDAPSQAPNVLQQDDFWGDDEEEVAFPAQVGGDIHDADEEASDARYAEGLPLINHDPPDVADSQEKTKAHDPFSEDGAEGDDFFAQIGENTNNVEQEDFDFTPGQLERKSTEQVINGLGARDAAGVRDLLDAPLEKEEDELFSDSPAVDQESTSPPAEATAQEPETKEDLAAKWSEAFADDDDGEFLLEDEPAPESQESKGLDPSAFFIDDDEGFLEDVEEAAPQPAQPPTSSSQAKPPQPNKYLPAAAAQPVAPQPSNSYFPAASPMIPSPQTLASVPTMGANPYAVQPPQQPVATPYGAPPPRPTPNKAQSFVDKAKGGYSSPYDLPMEVVKPRKRASHQQLPRGASTPLGAPAAPPRSSSMGPPAVQGPPGRVPPPQAPPQMQSSVSSVSPPVSAHSGQPPSLAKPSHSKSGFFEELPSSVKTRPASRTSTMGQPSPLQASFHGALQSSQPPPTSMPTPPQDSSVAGPSVTADTPRLVPPAPTNPYAALPAAATSASSIIPPAAARYSPASAPGSVPNGGVPPTSRYSPAPPVQRPTGYGPGHTATPPSVLPHLPRTSSPLAHFEAKSAAGQVEPLQATRSNSSLYEPRLQRMPSLPSTREVEEEDRTSIAPPAASQLPPRGRQHVPSPLDSHSANPMSPPKRKISYGGVSAGHDFAPPPRSQTGSPGAMHGLRSPIKASEISPRPSSAQGPAPVSIASAMNPIPASATSTRPRALSQKFNLIPPTDGREHDPLQRWKGVPLISWGVGGTLITSFPVEIPRYGMNQAGPMIIRSPGEIKAKTIKEVQPLEERIANFPGPLRGKSKKKETINWLTAGIQILEKGLPSLAFQTQLSHEDKRAVERVLLWKVLRVMIENDGILEGNPTVDKSVRDVLSLSPTTGEEVTSPVYASGDTLGFGESSATQMQADSVDSGTVQRLKKSLLAGDRENAVWDAADKRLWGHALLIANTVSPSLYHKVSQEFIKKEVNFPGHNNESLAALYSVLSGNHEESVDELVPVHARAGLQLLATSDGPANGSGSMEGLEKWRETLTLVLSNRSTGDAQALNSLGNLLSGYGRAEAAHICFLFARSATVFGGLDDPRSQFVLIGADHRTQSQQFFKETEALLLSEVYEYGLSLTGTTSLANGVPHLSVYKLQHAITLAEHGFRDKALQYCDIILKDMSAQTKRSPYHHLVLESAVEDLRQRMLQAPSKEGSGSWISKPSMNKVSDSVWSRFNKFVAGDEDAPGQGSPKFGEEGPFAGLAGGTPTVSRPPSAGNATGMDMFGSPSGYAAGAPSLAPTASPILTRSASRYAPAAAQASVSGSPYEPSPAYTPSGRSPMDRTSGEYSRSSYEPRRSSDIPSAARAVNVPSSASAPVPSYPDPALGIMQQSPYQSVPPTASTTASGPTPGQSSAGPKTPNFSPYTPLSQSPYASVTNNASPYAPGAPIVDDKPSAGDEQGYGFQPPSLDREEDQLPQTTRKSTGGGGYEPPSYGYEPPSYQPDIPANNHDADDDESRSKKKSFMEDDDDDIYPSTTSTQAAEKSKAEKDRENEELFRRAAEEDGKQAFYKTMPKSLHSKHAN